MRLHHFLITSLVCALPLRCTHSHTPIPHTLFTELEELARVVDIAYCVGTSGVHHPFVCASRCHDFPSFELVDTFNTGPLLSDSCGYIALDHGNSARESRVDHGGAPHGDGGDKRRRSPRIMVAFRGTYSIANTIADLSTIPQEYIPYPDQPADEIRTSREITCHNCTVHSGFWRSWQNTRGIIVEYLSLLRYKYPDYQIHLVGHSLGGAVAALAGLELHSYGWDPIVTTFGEPKIGNRGLRDYLDATFDLRNAQPGSSAVSARFRRVTHIHDPVPLLPLREWGYLPHAGEIFIEKEALQPDFDHVSFCSGDEDPRCSWQAEADELEDAESKQAMLALQASSSETEHAQQRPWQRLLRLRAWQLFFAHRDYFWRLGLCIPGGDPLDWGRDKYPVDEESSQRQETDSDVFSSL